MKRLINILLVLTVVFLLTVTNDNMVYLQADESTNDEWINTATFRENSYLYKYNDLMKNNQVVETDELTFVNSETTLNKNTATTFIVTAPETGLYELGLDYYLDEDFSNTPFIEVKVNNQTPFNEAESIRLNVLWDLQERSEENKYDRYGNELLPYSTSSNQWYKMYLTDNNLYFNTPYKFLLQEGDNTITFTPDTELQVKNLYLHNTEELITYSDYYDTVEDSNDASSIIRIEAESFSNKNNLEIKSSYYKYPSLEPFSYKTNVLNILDGEAMDQGSDKVTYSFTVEEDGLYTISLKYKQHDQIGVATSRNIYIDGVIPFKEFENYIFNATDNWTNETLGSSEAYQVYLEKGNHTLSLEVTNEVFREYVIRLQQIMDDINSIGLKVSTITGNQNNAYRTWDIVKYIPNISETLTSYASEVQTIYNELNEMNTTEDTVPELSTLLIVSEKLQALSEKPNDIPNKMAELNEGSGSSYQLLGVSIGILTNQPMDIDSIYIHNNTELPKATANIFTRSWIGIKSFFYSFFDERYQSTSKEEGELEVWVGESSLYVNLMQQMVDDTFTKDTGIKVNLRVLSNNQKIILSNANNTSPDIVMGIDSWLMYDYALRGMTVDLTKFDNFEEVASHYSQGIFTPMIFEDGVYGLPETQGTQIMVYRTDILEYLELEAPDTWDDVIEMLPILQSYQMNFYHPLGGVSSWKGYMMTAPFLYQFGGEVYGTYAHESALQQEETKEAIQFMTDLFTVYNLPKQTSSFFEHFRSGSMPIGVTDIGTYLQIKYAASELTGQWEIMPIPGNDLSGDGTIERYQPAYGKAGMIIEDSDMVDEAWKFMSYWNSAENQAEYLQTIKMNLGERYMIIPANLDALENSVWNQEVKDTYLAQAEWIRTPAITPGSYIVEREFSNIWNKIVIDRVNPRIAIDESIIRVERELERKLREFGYIEQGETTSDYIVPKMDNINDWIRGEEDDD